MLGFDFAPRGARGWITATGLVAALGWAAGCGSAVSGPGGAGGQGSTTSSSSSGSSTTGSSSSGSSTTSSSSSGSTTTSSSSSSSSSSGAPCNPACGFMLTCCDGTCVELDNDPHNCGACGETCPDGTYCHEKNCVVPACSLEGGACASDTTCCGAQCCGDGMLCCDDYGGPIQPNPHCDVAVNGTCPHSCYVCN